MAFALTIVPVIGLSQAVQMMAGRERVKWSRRAVVREADFLDGVVDTQLEFIRRLPMHRRAGAVEALAALVMLAQDHRYCAQGWISRRELRARTRRALAGLDTLLQLPGTAAALVPRESREY